MNPIRHLPNSLTLGNLLCGCAGIVCAFTQPELSLAWFVWAACLFDFLDGFSARLLKVSSAIGKELDSLADVISFGVLPSVQMYVLGLKHGPVVASSGFLLAAFAALRLAKFNVDTRQSDSFIGLPTPAMALFITGLPYLFRLVGMSETPAWLLMAATVMMAVFMVAEIPMPALKFKSFTWKGNETIFLLLAVVLILILILGGTGIPIAILLYLVLSLLRRFQTKTS